MSVYPQFVWMGIIFLTAFLHLAPSTAAEGLPGRAEG